MGCVFDESGTDRTEYSRKVVSGMRMACAIRSLDNARDLKLCVLDSCMKHCLYYFLCMALRQCYGSRRRDLELRMYGWKGFLGIRRMDSKGVVQSD